MTASAPSGRGLCYVVLIFNDVTQLFFGLWSIWDVRNTYILVVDAKSCSECKSLCKLLSERFENVTTIDGPNCTWAGYSLVAASLIGIRAALRRNRSWEHLFLISGNHVALHDQERLHSCLTVGKSYLRAHPISYVPRPSDAEFLTISETHRRLWGQWDEVPGIKPVMTGIKTHLPGCQFFKGSQWMALSRAACKALSRPRAAALSDFFAHVLVPDEMFFHTVVRALDVPENVVPVATTYHGWNDAHATDLTESEYQRAAQEGWWFGRKLPRSITSGYADLIREHTHTVDLDSFVNLANPRSLRGPRIRYNNDTISVDGSERENGDRAALHVRHEKLIRALRKAAGSAQINGRLGDGVLNICIEPPAMAPGRSPVIGFIRSSDGKIAWLTIQLRAGRFSDHVASLLLSSDRLRKVIDDTFEPTHMEWGFREFFRRQFRMAYVFEVDKVESSRIRSKLKAFCELLDEAWARLRPRDVAAPEGTLRSPE